MVSHSGGGSKGWPSLPVPHMHVCWTGWDASKGFFPLFQSYCLLFLKDSKVQMKPYITRKGQILCLSMKKGKKKHLGRYRIVGLTSALEKITAELLMISFSRHLNGAKEWGHELYSTLDRPHFKYWMNFGPCNMRETLENWRGFSEGLPRWLED